MIRRLRVFERKKKSGTAPTNGISPSSQSTPMFPAIRADMPLRHAEVARFPGHVAPSAAATVGPTPGNEVEDDVEADGPVDARNDDHALQQVLDRFDPLPHGGGSVAMDGSLGFGGPSFAVGLRSALMRRRPASAVERIAVRWKSLHAVRNQRPADWSRDGNE